MAMKLLTFVLTLVCLRTSLAYSDGAPVDSCDSMIPGHTPNQPEKDSPFFLKAFKSGVRGEVIVQLQSNDNRPFFGFLIKAFHPELYGDARHLGEFVNFYNYANKLQCPLEQVLTHINSDPKTQLTFTWKSNESGNIQFRATVVERYDTFYTNILSPVINV